MSKNKIAGQKYFEEARESFANLGLSSKRDPRFVDRKGNAPAHSGWVNNKVPSQM